MAQSLSLDLRERAVSAVDGGLSRRQAAARFSGQRGERDPLVSAPHGVGQCGAGQAGG